MTSSRPYRQKGLSLEKAKDELRNSAGAQFDPEIIEFILKNNIL
jgi:HD-GYP domain-containing protein (c-di-GMP phosphodiesterase class II)